MKKEIFTKTLFLALLLLLGMQNVNADVADPPETLPVAPTHDATSVKSIFCGAYTDITTISGLSGQGSATSTIKPVLGDNMIYFNKGLGGWSFAEFGTTINIDDCEAICFDIYVVKSGFSLKVYFGQGSSVTVPTPLVEGWNKVEIKLDEYRNLPAGKIPDLTQISKIGFINAGGYDRIVYIDNIYAYGDLGGGEPNPSDPNAPTLQAPKPQHAQEDVKSIFSDTYANVSNLILNNPGSPAAEMTVITPFEGDNMLRFTSLNWVLVKFDPILNLDDMDYIHFDIWAESARTIKIGLGSWSLQPNTDALNLEAGWNSFDIPMTVFKAADLTSIIVSKIFSGNGFAITRLYFDNIYAYKGDPISEKPVPTYEIESAPEPILAPKTVKSLFTEKYSNIAEIEKEGVGLTDFKLVYLTDKDKVLRMRSLTDLSLALTTAVDFSDMENIHFSVFCDTKGGDAALEIGLQSQGSESVYYSTLLPELKPDAWNYVNIPLQDLVSAGLDNTAISAIHFRGSGNIYIDNIFGFKGEYTLGLGEEGKIAIDWEDASKDDVLPDRNKPFLGVNLATASGGTVHGEYNTNYSYPTFKDLHYFKAKGVRLVRFPFRWERVQHEVNGPLDMEFDVKKIKEVVAEAERIGMYVMLDMHDYCRRKVDGTTYKFGESDKLTKEHFADVWYKLATEFKDFTNIWGYDIMNEPYSLAKGVWFASAQAAIDAIRTVDTETPIVIEGQNYAASYSWLTTGADLIDLNDPSDNLVFQAHCYFDQNRTGHYELGSYDLEVSSATQHIDRLKPYVEWLKENNQKGILGEFGVPRADVRWLTMLDEVIAYLKENKVSATYWVAGSWYAGDKVSVQPLEEYTLERAQMRILDKYILNYDEGYVGLEDKQIAGADSRIVTYSSLVTDKISIDSKDAISMVNVYSLSGQMVKTIQVKDNHTDIDMQDVAKGVYLMEVRLGNGHVESGKIVKL